MSDRILLGVNIDHIATLRQARGTNYPDPIYAAQIAEEAGADGITVHLREDRRHIIDRDVELLVGIVQTRLNLEMAVTDEMIGIATKLKPAHCCLVPEKREEVTTEGGLDVVSQFDRVKSACETLADAGIEVSLFIDAEEAQIQASADCGASTIEIHTGHYADAVDESERNDELQRIKRGVEVGLKRGLIVNAGHGLHYHNIKDVAAIPGITELNIGHSIIARAAFTGLKEAVVEMKRLMLEARQGI